MNIGVITAIAAATFEFAAAATASGRTESLRDHLTEAHWLAPGADSASFLSRSPGECLKKPEDPDQAWLVEVGRAAFRSPFLFGGAAARTGLSCNVCHRDGRDNPAFFLSGFSGAPGTADVTSSVFSKKREDGAANPVRIPSLVGAGDKKSFGTIAPHPSLDAFIHSAVEDEFQGAAPPKTALDGLTAYVNHLDPTACPSGAQARTPGGDMNDVGRTLAAARIALARGDGGTADFLLASAERALGGVNERFPGRRFAGERARLAALSRDVAALRARAAERPDEAANGFLAVEAEAGGLAKRLERKSDRSLYNLKRLERAVEAGVQSE